MRISVEGLLRPASPTRGPPFVPSRIILVRLSCPLTRPRSRVLESARALPAIRNLRRLKAMVFLTLILFQSGAEAKHVAIRMAQMKFAHAPGFIGGRHGHRQTVVQGQLMCGINVGR